MKHLYRLPALRIMVVLLSVSMMVSCQREKPTFDNVGDVFAEVMKNNDGIFRGTRLGDKMDMVSSLEGIDPVTEDESSLYFEHEIDSLTTYSVMYSFDENGELNELQLSLFMIANINSIDDIYGDFEDYFKGYYGESTFEKGLTTWSVNSDKFDDIKINISQESPSFAADGNAHGKISVWIYPSFE